MRPRSSHGERPAQVLTVPPCMLRAGTNSFAQDLPLELGEDRRQAGHRSAGRRRQIQRFRHRHETDSQMLQFLQGRRQVRRRPPPAIEPLPSRPFDFCGNLRFFLIFAPQRADNPRIQG